MHQHERVGAVAIDGIGITYLHKDVFAADIMGSLDFKVIQTEWSSRVYSM